MVWSLVAANPIGLFEITSNAGLRLGFVGGVERLYFVESAYFCPKKLGVFPGHLSYPSNQKNYQ